MPNSSRPKAHIHLQARYPVDRAIALVLQEYFKTTSGPLLIALGGPGGGGKTTLAAKLNRRLPESTTLHLDNYKTARHNRQHQNIAGPHPDANQMELIKSHLTAIKAGTSFTTPVYNGITGDTGSYEAYTPQRFNIIEGEVATYKEFRHLIDLSLFIDADFHTQLTTRMQRDVSIRGHSIEKAVRTFLKSNLDEFIRFGAESKQWSDLQLFCHEDYHLTLEAVREDLVPLFMNCVSSIETIDVTGLIVPITTPFNEDRSLCKAAFVEHLAYLANRGVARILVGGTTAEFFSLTLRERVTLLKLAREYFPGLLIFNISAESMHSTIELARQGCRFGAEALICLPPYYYAGAPTAGIATYFKTVAAACELPLYLYNFPKHTGNPLTPKLLAAVPHAGIKDSAGNLALVSATKRYILGGESKLVEAYRAGACGFVPALPNAFPEIYIAVEQALARQDFATATLHLEHIAHFKKSLPAISGIVVTKELLHQRLPSYPSTVRPPLDYAPAAPINFTNEQLTHMQHPSTQP